MNSGLEGRTMACRLIPSLILVASTLAGTQIAPQGVAPATFREEALPPARPWIELRGFSGKGGTVRGAGWEAEYPELSLISSARTADGSRVAIAAKRTHWVMLVDGKEFGPYEAAISPVFSPDGKRLAYYAKRNGMWRAVVDGQEGPEFPGPPNELALTLAFSPDSRRVAYVAFTRINRGRLIIDGQAWPEWQDWGKQQILFSPDSQHVAAWGRVPGWLTPWVIGLDGREVCRMNLLGGVSFNPRTSELAAVGAIEIGGRVSSTTFGLKPGLQMDPARRFELRVGGGQGPLSHIHSLQFSADGAHFAYAITDETQVDIYVDGRSVFHSAGNHDGLSRYGSMDPARNARALLLGPDGTRLVAMLTGKSPRILDIQMGPDAATGHWVAKRVQTHLVVGAPEQLLLSPSGRHVAYWAHRPRLRTSEQWIVVDGQEGPHYTWIPPELSWGPAEEIIYKRGNVGAVSHRVNQVPPRVPMWTTREKE